MKVVHINAVYNMSSTGRNVMELHSALLSQGHESYVVCSQAENINDKNLYCMGSPIETKLHGLFSRITGKQGYFSFFSTKQMLRFLDKINPDVVHLNNLHGNYINLPMLLKYLAEKDIATVITLHDFWFLTGKCVHYITEKCNKWQTECGNCPNLHSGNPSWFFDQTHKMHRDKKMLFKNIPRLAIIGVSQWVTDEAKKSPIAYNAITKCIYNWIDFNDFYPRNVETLKNEKGLQDKFTVLGVASSWAAQKGLEDFISLANQKKDFNFVLVGSIPENVQLPENISSVGLASSADELAEYYSMADAFVSFSPAETFGKVSAEALACGTPVVCYNTTASPELVGEGCGYVVELGNISAVGDALDKIKKDGKSEYSRNCIQFVQSKFEKESLINEHISLYNQLSERK